MTYTDGFRPDSEAMHQCDESQGFVLSNPCNTTRICTENGWTGEPLQCRSKTISHNVYIIYYSFLYITAIINNP